MTQEQFFLSNFAYFQANPELDIHFTEEQTDDEFRLHLTTDKFQIFRAMKLEDYKLEPEKSKERLFNSLNRDIFKMAFQSKLN